VEENVETHENGQLKEGGQEIGALLYVTDLVNDSQEILEFACELAENQGAKLEILHVIDPQETSSSPDAQMGIQFSLESLARSLRNLRNGTQAHLLFGRPEVVISRHALDTKAALIAISESAPSKQLVQRALVRRLSQTCTCPVLLFSTFSVIGMRNSHKWNLAFR
jgi:nucleotide-binding universal stress UspA family protein